MFSTYPQFRFPIQIDKDSTTWRAIEINLRRPFVLATIRASRAGEEDVLLDFIVSGDDDLLYFSENCPLGIMESAQLMLPPVEPEDKDWQFVRVARIDCTKAEHPSLRRAVVTAVNGTRYTSMRAEPADRSFGALEPLVEFMKVGLQGPSTTTELVHRAHQRAQ